jgi:hypothetical protein
LFALFNEQRPAITIDGLIVDKDRILDGRAYAPADAFAAASVGYLR